MTTRHRLATTDQHEHHHPEESDEEEVLPEFLPSHIFDAAYCGEEIPEGFDSVRIPIDGSIKADLSWKKEREAALHYVKQGRRLLWDLDLGLPGSLPHPLSHRPQFLSLALSLDHFRDTLWKEFRKETIGLCLYRGSPDFSLHYPWDGEQIHNLQAWLAEFFTTIEAFTEETGIATADFSLLTPEILARSKTGKELMRMFCRNAIAEYLTLLSARVSDALPLFLLFDVTSFQEPVEIAQLVTKELYSRFLLAIKSDFPRAVEMFDGDLPWEGATTCQGMIGRELLWTQDKDSHAEAKIGLCLPHATQCLPSHLHMLKQAAADLLQRNIPFRIIPQRDLAAKWEGLDELVVNPSCVDAALERQLRGFRAAGGQIR